MKSIVEEASSILKAVEKAWIRAGKPQSFQVKVFEEPVKSFFGFTKRSAKVGLFFNEQVQRTKRGTRPDVKRQGARLDSRVKKPVGSVQSDSKKSPQSNEKPKPRWTDDMISATRDWVDHVLVVSGHKDVAYSISPRGYALNIVFNKPIFSDKKREQTLFKGLAHLITNMLRTKFKRGMMNFKIILKSS